MIIDLDKHILLEVTYSRDQRYAIGGSPERTAQPLLLTRGRQQPHVRKLLGTVFYVNVFNRRYHDDHLYTCSVFLR